MNNPNPMAVISAQEEKLTNDIDDLAHAFESSHAVTLGRMQEDLFVNVFLPFFAGDEVQHYPVTTEMWLQQTHSPYNELIIIDINGAELFRVPPLFDKEAFRPLDNKSADRSMPTIYDMMQTVMNIGKQGYGAMINYFNNEMQRRDFMFAQPVNVPENIRRWNEIFVRYNRKPIITDQANAAITPTNRPVGLDSEEFEPLD